MTVFYVSTLCWASAQHKKPGHDASAFHFSADVLEQYMAGRTGIEPVTSDVTGRRSNQLNYRPRREKIVIRGRG